MDSLDLHPEELFDKAARGVASADELGRIDAHLKSCATCRFERQVRADFDAVNVSPDNLDDLVARAMSGAVTPGATSSAIPSRRRFAPLLAAAVAVLGVSSLAAVAHVTGVLPRVVARFIKTPEAPAPTPGPAPERARTLVPVLPQAPVVEEAPLTPPPMPPPSVHPSPVVVRVEPKKVAVVEAPAPAPAPAVVVEPEPDALTLFTRAQRARVQGETAAAIADFRTLIARYPQAKESAAAHAQLGRLLLDRGEAASALEALDAYLASGDTVLREDVLGARAMALRSLGRVEDERRAWEAVLRDYPSGVYAPRARTRLESLAP